MVGRKIFQYGSVGQQCMRAIEKRWEAKTRIARRWSQPYYSMAGRLESVSGRSEKRKRVRVGGWRTGRKCDVPISRQFDRMSDPGNWSCTRNLDYHSNRSGLKPLTGEGGANGRAMDGIDGKPQWWSNWIIAYWTDRQEKNNYVKRPLVSRCQREEESMRRRRHRSRRRITLMSVITIGRMIRNAQWKEAINFEWRLLAVFATENDWKKKSERGNNEEGQNHRVHHGASI